MVGGVEEDKKAGEGEGVKRKEGREGVGRGAKRERQATVGGRMGKQHKDGWGGRLAKNRAGRMEEGRSKQQLEEGDDEMGGTAYTCTLFIECVCKGF